MVNNVTKIKNIKSLLDNFERVRIKSQAEIEFLICIYTYISKDSERDAYLNK